MTSRPVASFQHAAFVPLIQRRVLNVPFRINMPDPNVRIRLQQIENLPRLIRDLRDGDVQEVHVHVWIHLSRGLDGTSLASIQRQIVLVEARCLVEEDISVRHRFICYSLKQRRDMFAKF